MTFSNVVPIKSVNTAPSEVEEIIQDFLWALMDKGIVQILDKKITPYSLLKHISPEEKDDALSRLICRDSDSRSYCVDLLRAGFDGVFDESDHQDIIQYYNDYGLFYYDY